GKITNVPAILSKAVLDNHPQVRLEAVIALRKLQTAEGARTALAVVEQPMDEFLDYATWQTIRELEPLWMKRLKTESGFLGNNRRTAFALKSVSNPDAIKQLVQLYLNDQVPEEYIKDVLALIAKSGKPADLNILLDMAVQGYARNDKSVVAQLGAIEEAARQRGLKPDRDLNRIAGFIESDDEAVAISSIRLIGLWRMEEMTDRLVSLIQKGDKNIKKTGLGALAAMNTEKAKKLLIDMTGAKNMPELRLLATTRLVSLDAPIAASIGVELFRNLPDQAGTTELFQAFLTNKQSIVALTEALTSKKIPEKIAKAGRQTMQGQLPGNRHNDDDVKLLKKALEASGGILPPERVSQQLNDQEITTLAKEIKGSADPDLGEMVFRKNSCFTCHAIGGAGGLIGPDLSSLGTSSPAETIIRSILSPNQSIKEGYELQRIIKKDGSELMGYIVSDGLTEIIIRDVTGLKVSVIKSQINVIEKIPGSLMPSGLTANLDKAEFVNLVAFLSKIGESGKYRVPNARFVRRWHAITGTKELAKKIRELGLDHILKENAKLLLQPAYSKVSGELPIKELPVIEVNANKRYTFVKFEIEVLSKGNVKFELNSIIGVTAWAGQKLLKLADRGVVADLPQGIHQITLAIDRTVHKDDPLSIQLQDAENSPAQTRLVMGQ
ncbi:MAG: c-type cytochrome, partial [Phormidesmis sp. FL-bin-119]|nr:c-type cytochrome [Pedobacter sp.]